MCHPILTNSPDREKAEARAQKAEEKRIQEEKKHEERRLRTEQKAAEKKAREEALAASRGNEATPTKTRLLPSFLSRGAAGTGAAAGGATAATVDAAEGNAAVAATSEPVYPTMPPVEPEEIEGDTVHEQVTMDQGEGAHAIESADTEAGVKAKPLEETTVGQPTTEAAADEEDEQEDTGTKDAVPSQPYSALQDTTSPTSPTSPTTPSKRDSRLSSWFKKFKTGSKAEHDAEKPALTDAERINATTDTTQGIEEEDKPTSDSIRDVALAGRKSDVETDDLYGGSARPEGRVSPVQEGEGQTEAHDAVTDPARPVSPVSESDAEEEPYVMAADVASSKYESEHGGGSKRDSGIDQFGALSDSDDEPRGRKGFRERFLKKVIPGRDKDKDKHKSTTTDSGVASAPIAEETTHDQITTDNAETDAEPHANPDPKILAKTEPLREKIQEPSTTSTEAANTATATGATTPALTRTQTSGDDDDDFEEARDHFDEQRLGPPAKLAEVAKMESPRLVDVGSKKSGESPVGHRNSIGSGSRFTEEL